MADILDLTLPYGSNDIKDGNTPWAYLFNGNYDAIVLKINEMLDVLNAAAASTAISIAIDDFRDSDIGDVGDLNSTATRLVEAVNELIVSISTTNTNIGEVGNLLTTAHTVVTAINELKTMLTGNFDLQFNRTINQADPINQSDGATKKWVENIIYNNANNVFSKQSVNTGALSSGVASCITVGTGLKPLILASTVPILGNCQYGQVLKSFLLSTDFLIPKNAPISRRSSIVLKDGSFGALTTDATKWDYACQRRQRGPVFDISKNLLVDFSGQDGTDKYGNALTVIGSPAFTSYQYASNGASGIKYAIPTLGRGNWCIEFRAKFNDTTSLYTLVATKIASGFVLTRTAANKLAIYLSSNNSSYDIANGTLGTKSDYGTSSTYHIAIEFDGTAYKVYVDGVLDLTVTSTSKVFSAITALIFGVNYAETTNPLGGTLNDIRCTLGNNRYGTTLFTPPTLNSLVADTYWEDTGTGYVKYGSPASWVNVEAVFIGEVVAGASTVSNVTTYAYNRRYESAATAWVNAHANTVTYSHNLGYEPKLHNVSAVIQSVYNEQGWAYGEKLKPFSNNTGADGFLYFVDEMLLKVVVSYYTVYIPSKTNNAYYSYSAATASYWREIANVDESNN